MLFPCPASPQILPTLAYIRCWLAAAQTLHVQTSCNPCHMSHMQPTQLTPSPHAYPLTAQHTTSPSTPGHPPSCHTSRACVKCGVPPTALDLPCAGLHTATVTCDPIGHIPSPHNTPSRHCIPLAQPPLATHQGHMPRVGCHWHIQACAGTPQHATCATHPTGAWPKTALPSQTLAACPHNRQ
jgi:hypothetical protein